MSGSFAMTRIVLRLCSDNSRLRLRGDGSSCLSQSPVHEGCGRRMFRYGDEVPACAGCGRGRYSLG
jgi:hypothetical protein